MKTRPLLTIALLLGILSLASVDTQFVLVHGATAGLHDVVLTGHSHGGMVITGVMDRVGNPVAKELPVTYVAFVPKDESADERAKTDKSWQ